MLPLARMLFALKLQSSREYVKFFTWVRMYSITRPAHLAPFGSAGIISEGNYRSLRSPIIIIGLIFRSRVESLVYPILFSTLRIIPSELLPQEDTRVYTIVPAVRMETSFSFHSKYPPLFRSDYRTNVIVSNNFSVKVKTILDFL